MRTASTPLEASSVNVNVDLEEMADPVKVSYPSSIQQLTCIFTNFHTSEI